MTLTPARALALRVLGTVREREAWSGPVLAAALADSSLSAADRALATRLVYGVLQAEGVLDEVIDSRAAGPPSAIEPLVRDALRLTVFELLFSRAPAHATVHQGVEAVKRRRPRATAFANAVLRRIAAEADGFPWGDPANDLDALSRLSAHPRWIVELALADLGEARAREMLATGLEGAPLTVRLNPFRARPEDALRALTDDGLDPAVVEPDSFSVRLAETSAYADSSAIAGGFAIPQDAAAQFAALAVGAHPAGVIVDLCAGRGGKTVVMQALAAAAGDPAVIYAVELHPARAAELRARLDELEVPGVSVIAGDATRPAELEGLPPGSFADAVLVDAPCTGLGTLRRYPEKRWRLRPDSLDAMGALQRGLLAAGAGLVRPGGRLVYSTCSIARAENDDVVSAFLAHEAGREFAPVSLEPIVPETWGAYLTTSGTFRSWPHSGGPDGHFVAAFVRTG